MNEEEFLQCPGRAPDVCFYVKCWRRGFQEESFRKRGQNKTVLGPEHRCEESLGASSSLPPCYSPLTTHPPPHPTPNPALGCIKLGQKQKTNSRRVRKGHGSFEVNTGGCEGHYPVEAVGRGRKFSGLSSGPIILSYIHSFMCECTISKTP